jgi:hypothetical protein
MLPNITTQEQNIIRTKALRETLDSIIDAVKSEIDGTREIALVITKLQEARMWAGQNIANYSNDFKQSQFADTSTVKTTFISQCQDSVNI